MITTVVKTLERKDRIVLFKGEAYFVGCTHPATDTEPPAFDLFCCEYGNAYFGESIIGLGELSDEMTAEDPDWKVLPLTVTLPQEVSLEGLRESYKNFLR
ncbi:hypothetical protein BC7_00070 [Bacillus phage BC-7]|nr:hypothetical protein BC7_00070 [Bacillus phage BC-7]